MEHIAALLLIIGCSSDYRDCRELPAPTSIYETMEECQADLSALPASYRSSDRKVVFGCIDVDPAMEEQDAELTWNVTPEGRLVASIDPASPLVAATMAPATHSNQ
jgi:hypothetical protein